MVSVSTITEQRVVQSTTKKVRYGKPVPRNIIVSISDSSSTDSLEKKINRIHIPSYNFRRSPSRFQLS